MKQNVTASEEAELSLNEVLAVLRRWKWRLLFFIAIITAGTYVVALMLPRKYEAVVLVSPVMNSANSGLLGSLNSSAPQLSSLAALAGLAPNSDSTKSESLAVLESEALTEKYIQENDLLPVLFPKKWDARKNTWKDTDPAKIPTLWEGNELFKKSIRKVSPDTRSGLVTLTITWTDARTAAKWANDLVRLTNEYRRNKAIDESQRNVEYLKTEVGTTDVVGIKQAIFSVLQSEISKMMLARGNEEYALKVIDPASPSQKPSFPKPLLWTFLSLSISILVSAALAFFYTSLNRGNP